MKEKRMKKSIFLIFFVLFFFQACKPDSPDPIIPDDNPVQNEEEYVWAYDAENHWHDEDDYAPHEWVETVISEPTYNEDGKLLYKCSVCHYEKTQVIAKLSHIHTFSDSWTIDSGFHWHSATCEHSDEKKDEAEHTWEETILKAPTDIEKGSKKFVCTVCGYEKTEIIPNLPPAGVTNLSLIPNDPVNNVYALGFEKATITWKNPSDSDFEKVIIKYGDGNQVEYFGAPGETMTKTIIGLINGEINTFYVKAVDTDGNESQRVTLEVAINGGLGGKAVTGQHQGKVFGDLVIDNQTLEKTSEVIIIPQGMVGVVAMSDDSSWNQYYSNVDNVYDENDLKGAFLKGRKIKLSPYAMGQYEVTSELYETIMKTNPSAHAQTNIHPANSMTWYEACVFCNELTKKIFGESECVYYSNPELTKVYTIDDAQQKTWNNQFQRWEDDPKSVYPAYNYVTFKWLKKGYRLPTEAEWEFAARGGDPNKDEWFYAFSGVQTEHPYLRYGTSTYIEEDSKLSDYSWYVGYLDGNRTHDSQPVNYKLPNSLGLYEMCGNVSEYCYDWYDQYKRIDYWDSLYFDDVYVSNPIGPEVEYKDRYSHCVRPSDYYWGEAFNLTVSYRSDQWHIFGDEYLGFRLARSLN